MLSNVSTSSNNMIIRCVRLNLRIRDNNNLKAYVIMYNLRCALVIKVSPELCITIIAP